MKGNRFSDEEDRHDPEGIYSNYIEEAIRTLKKIGRILPPLPLPQLHTIEDKIIIKEEILNNLKKDEK